VQDVKYAIDIYPATREMVMRVEEQIKNITAQPIDAVHFTYDRNFSSTIELPGATLAQDDAERGYRIYKLSTPLAPARRAR